ncbi:MAG TPA: hypothetical protein VFD05_02050 [Bacilli bacterium]|nr:hypothetical protein [Bacilli bacterium]
MDLNKIKNLLEPTVQDLGFTLLSVKYFSRGKRHYLEVVIDNFLTPISLNDIVRVSDAINPLLDDVSELSNNYILDVTSSGAEKEIPLEHLSKYVAGYITVTLTEALQGTTKVTGHLEKYTNDELEMKTNQKGKITTVKIPVNIIKKVNLALKF